MVNLQTGNLDLNGTSLHYELAGEGHPLVLLHASTVDSRMWDDQFKQFAERYRVLRYDFRGFGKSARPTAPYSDVEDLRAVLDAFEMSRAHVVGASMGGNVALGLAVTYPERVSALILVSTGLGGFTAYTPATVRLAMQIEAIAQAGEMMGAVEAMLKMWVDGTRASAAVEGSIRMKLHRWLADNAHTIVAQEFSIPLQPPPIEQLGQIQAPTLLIVGDKDRPDMLEIADTIMERIPANVEKLVLPDVGHFLSVEKPVEFGQVVLTYLQNR